MRGLTHAIKLTALLALLAVLAPPAMAQVHGIGNAPAGQCTAGAVYDTNASGNTQLVGLVAAKAVYLCSVVLWAGASATNVGLVYGTGSACGTNETALTPLFRLAANTGVVLPGELWNGLTAPAGTALCLKTSAGNPVQALVTYSQFGSP